MKRRPWLLKVTASGYGYGSWVMIMICDVMTLTSYVTGTYHYIDRYAHCRTDIVVLPSMLNSLSVSKIMYINFPTYKYFLATIQPLNAGYISVLLLYEISIKERRRTFK